MRARGIGEEKADGQLRNAAMEQGKTFADPAQPLVMSTDLLK